MSQSLKELPFPWTCGKCRQQAVFRETVPYSIEVASNGRTCAVDVPHFEVPRCKNCGAMVLDDDANDQITDALRRQVGPAVRASRGIRYDSQPPDPFHG
jgi:hypothetical protein